MHSYIYYTVIFTKEGRNSYIAFSSFPPSGFLDLNTRKIQWNKGQVSVRHFHNLIGNSNSSSNFNGRATWKLVVAFHTKTALAEPDEGLWMCRGFTVQKKVRKGLVLIPLSKPSLACLRGKARRQGVKHPQLPPGRVTGQAREAREQRRVNQQRYVNI